jgi:hypothetical protein
MLKTKIESAKNYVRDHKVALAVTVTAIVGTAVHVRIIHDHNEFLKDHDLFDAYYETDEI